MIVYNFCELKQQYLTAAQLSQGTCACHKRSRQVSKEPPSLAAAVSSRELRPPPVPGGSAPLTSGTVLPVVSSLILSHCSDCTPPALLGAY